ncbi:MAG: ribonuclease H-like domain-containing protein [Promethearchaeota archaeon]
MNELKKENFHLKISKTLVLGLKKGSLIDFETTGLFTTNKEHEVITLGYLEDNKITIIQRSTKDKNLFYNEIKNILERLSKPFYCYNSKFEREVMEKELKLKIDDFHFIDLMKPWRNKANKLNKKWPKLDDLISEPEDYFKENKVCGKDIPKLWKKYLASGDNSLLKKISDHCFSDILREMILLIRYHP